MIIPLFIAKGENMEPIIDEYMRTSIPGLYSIGDVNKKHLRQIVTATSDGAIAAIAITKYIQNL
jgi:thioredoxin reductase (NADPH)